LSSRRQRSFDAIQDEGAGADEIRQLTSACSAAARQQACDSTNGFVGVWSAATRQAP
jgi:hypothetical protein